MQRQRSNKKSVYLSKLGDQHKALRQEEKSEDEGKANSKTNFLAEKASNHDCGWQNREQGGMRRAQKKQFSSTDPRNTGEASGTRR